MVNVSRGAGLWNKALEVIPGGCQLLSKRAESFTSSGWPSYYTKAEGVFVWDLDGNKFIDMSLMGVGSCILGYADEDVGRAVQDAVKRGSMSTLNCPEEVELAELLLRLHSWADMVRYARTGGEAMAVAVRIARSYTGKDRVAFCGYHGWHDWYLSANLMDSQNLNVHLLPSLNPAGVPACLRGSAVPFTYNRLDELKAVVDGGGVGVIVVEPIRHINPEPGFLRGVRRIADDCGAVLVFDEITSGWRMVCGGSHLLYGVYPDIAVFGKAMSNGYPMAAVVGRGDVMSSVQEGFISSTYWSERIGPVAALATIWKLCEGDVPSHLCLLGEVVAKEFRKLGVEVLEGIPSIPCMVFDDAFDLSGVMLGRGYLASKKIYLSNAHSMDLVDEYLSVFEEVYNG